MMKETLGIKIIDENGMVRKEQRGENQLTLIYPEKYAENDQIIIESSQVPAALRVSLDDTIPPAYIWLTKPAMTYTIPFGEPGEAYPREAFGGSMHFIRVEQVPEEIWNTCRNISENSLDQKGEVSCYPHCTATVETRDESVFAARNTIDGRFENTDHGKWPYTSWGDNEDPDAQIQIDFGRTVEAERVEIVLRADFPHDNYWQEATLEFSDGSTLLLELRKTGEKQAFAFPPKKTEWVRLTHLIKSQEPSPFPALSQWCVFGR
ncbi:MAG: carbohydrate-binding protein [Lachnospiraceae bacterium]|nr:carbohydrate-binding protein [Lachnospiraceae bacterium]